MKGPRRLRYRCEIHAPEGPEALAVVSHGGSPMLEGSGGVRASLLLRWGPLRRSDQRTSQVKGR